MRRIRATISPVDSAERFSKELGVDVYLVREFSLSKISQSNREGQDLLERIQLKSMKKHSDLPLQLLRRVVLQAYLRFLGFETFPS